MIFFLISLVLLMYSDLCITQCFNPLRGIATDFLPIQSQKQIGILTQLLFDELLHNNFISH